MLLCSKFKIEQIFNSFNDQTIFIDIKSYQFIPNIINLPSNEFPRCKIRKLAIIFCALIEVKGQKNGDLSIENGVSLNKFERSGQLQKIKKEEHWKKVNQCFMEGSVRYQKGRLPSRM